ncbi:MAG: TraB/GumN family protein [Paraburkholderia sp.]|uniref:TraB/GumN family protein n=1 Tax=Paraburkholderia sp. TaxID=1926495 RepID=UPI003C5496A1
MLWKIEGSETYVLGSVHFTNLSPLRLPITVAEVFRTASQIVFEADLSERPDSAPLLLPSGTTLKDCVSDITLAKARSNWVRLGLPEDNLLRFKPGAVAQILHINQAARHGYVFERGIDRVLWDRAADAAKHRARLEKVEAQTNALQSSPIAEQASMLEYFVNGDLGVSVLSSMVTAWKQGNTGPFDAVLAERRRRWPAMFDILIDRRNRDWVPTIAQMVSDRERRLIVVGASHMVGPTSLSSLLFKRGLRLRAQPWHFPGYSRLP